MGCFSACVRLTRLTRTRRKSRKPANRISSSDHQIHKFNVISPPDQESVERPINPIKESKLRLEDILNHSDTKKDPIDLNGDDCEQIGNVDRIDEEEGKKEKLEEKEEAPRKILIPSPPPNYRYKNFADSDDEYEGFDLHDANFDNVVVVDEGKDIGGEKSTEETFDSLFSISIESKAHVGSAEKGDKEVSSPMPVKSSQNGSEEEALRQPLLNPVENLTQWKVVDSPNAKPPPEDQAKENLNLDHYLNRPPISPEPSFKSPAANSRNRTPLDHREVTVETSLSSWLVDTGPTPDAKSCDSASVGCCSPNERAVNSVVSHHDRPILGALTVEELRQISATSSPRKLSRQSPDDVPIIGSVGSYWSHTGVAAGSDSGSSCKVGSGRTTPSKYREDQRVIWNPTPFETRLDQALNAGVAEF